MQVLTDDNAIPIRNLSTTKGSDMLTGIALVITGLVFGLLSDHGRWGKVTATMLGLVGLLLAMLGIIAIAAELATP